MRSKKWTYIIHISAWLLFLSIPFIVGFILNQSPPNNLPPPPNLADFDKTELFQYISFVAIFIIGFYYLNSNVLIIRLLLRKKIAAYALSVLGCYFLFVYNFRPLVTFAPPKGMVMPPVEFITMVSKLIGSLVFLLVLLVSTGIRLTQQWYDTEKKRISSDKEKAETELSFLKAQINPHFLFNTLNSIYTLALKKSDKTPDAVMYLSNMMRFVTSEAKSDCVSLENELQYIQHFIDLQELRLAKNITVNTQIECDDMDAQIAPLLLIPFIENAFKYGVSSRETATIEIGIFVEKGSLNMSVQNQKFKATNENKDKSGIGLDNTKRRLEMLYPNRYALTINDLEGSYSVKLRLELAKT